MIPSYSKGCFQERTNSWNCIFQHFLDEIFLFLLWHTWNYLKKTFHLDFPFILSLRLLICKPFQDFGFLFHWEEEGFGCSDWQWGGRLPSLALTWHGVVVRIHAHQQGKTLQCDTLAAFWSLSGAPAWNSSSWQRSSMLKPFPRAALHAQLSLFTCVFLSGLGFVPYIAMSFVLPGAAWFWSKPWT